MKQAY